LTGSALYRLLSGTRGVAATIFCGFASVPADAEPHPAGRLQVCPAPPLKPVEDMGDGDDGVNAVGGRLSRHLQAFRYMGGPSSMPGSIWQCRSIKGKRCVFLDRGYRINRI